MLKNGTRYIDLGQDYYEERYQSRLIQNLKRKANAKVELNINYIDKWVNQEY